MPKAEELVSCITTRRVRHLSTAPHTSRGSAAGSLLLGASLLLAAFSLPESAAAGAAVDASSTGDTAGASAAPASSARANIWRHMLPVRRLCPTRLL